MFIQINATQVVNLHRIVGIQIDPDTKRIIRLFSDDGDSWVVESAYSTKVQNAISRLNFYYTK